MKLSIKICFLNRKKWCCGLALFAIPVLVAVFAAVAALYLSHFAITSATFSSAARLLSELPKTS